MIKIHGKEVFTSIDEIVRPSHSALVIIDVQNDFYSEEGLFARHGHDVSPLKAVLPRIRWVIDEARTAGVLVIYVQHISYLGHLSESPVWLRFQTVRYGLPPDEYFQLKGSWGAQIVDEVAPTHTDPIVTKHRSSAFIGTDLDMLLRSNNIKSTIIVGDVTQGCVESTARDAAFFDYYPVVISDAVASLDNKLHEASLYVMSSRLDVTTAETVVPTWRSHPCVDRKELFASIAQSTSPSQDQFADRSPAKERAR